MKTQTVSTEYLEALEHFLKISNELYTHDSACMCMLCRIMKHLIKIRDSDSKSRLEDARGE